MSLCLPDALTQHELWTNALTHFWINSSTAGLIFATPPLEWRPFPIIISKMMGQGYKRNGTDQQLAWSETARLTWPVEWIGLHDLWLPWHAAHGDQSRQGFYPMFGDSACGLGWVRVSLVVTCTLLFSVEVDEYIRKLEGIAYQWRSNRLLAR